MAISMLETLRGHVRITRAAFRGDKYVGDTQGDTLGSPGPLDKYNIPLDKYNIR